MSTDRNFDEIFEQFHRRIKGTKKGLLREALLREDIEALVLRTKTGKLRVLDAGCGLGDMGLWLASQGHEVWATDISEKMVAHTRSKAQEAGLADLLHVEQQSVQAALQAGRTYDLICIHAVMEWLAEPYAMLALIPPALAPGGFVSLSVYNLHRSVFNSLIKGSFRKVMAEDFSGISNAMTPPNPIDPQQVTIELEKLGLKVSLQAGLRCFYDYFSPKAKEEHSLDDVLVLERRYRHLVPYRDFARYVHFIAQKIS